MYQLLRMFMPRENLTKNELLAAFEEAMSKAATRASIKISMQIIGMRRDVRRACRDAFNATTEEEDRQMILRRLCTALVVSASSGLAQGLWAAIPESVNYEEMAIVAFKDTLKAIRKSEGGDFGDKEEF